MEKLIITKKLERFDRELHLLIDELKTENPKKSMSLAELNKLMEKDRILDVDTTKLIREMRDKEYNL